MMNCPKVMLLVVLWGGMGCDDGGGSSADGAAGSGSGGSSVGMGGAGANLGGGGAGVGAAGDGGAGGQAPPCFTGVKCADYGDCQDGMSCNVALGECQPLNCSPDGTQCSTGSTCASEHCDEEVCRACDCTSLCEAKVECFNGLDDVAECVQQCEANGGTVNPCACPFLAQPWCVDLLNCSGG